jgi:hypothetical protein
MDLYRKQQLVIAEDAGGDVDDLGYRWLGAAKVETRGC